MEDVQKKSDRPCDPVGSADEVTSSMPPRAVFRFPVCNQQKGAKTSEAEPLIATTVPSEVLPCLAWLVLATLLIGIQAGCQTEQFWLGRSKIRFSSASTSVRHLSQALGERDVPASVSSASNAREDSPPAEGGERLNPASLSPDQPDLNPRDILSPTVTNQTNVENESKPAADAFHLTVEDVIDSVCETLPQLRAIFQETAIAQGNLTAAMGAFDFNLSGQSTSQPLGFYQNYRNSVGFSQNIMPTGSNLYGGYRLGRGAYPTWYKDRETNEGGEFAIGTTIPLRRNRLIDARRAAVFRAQQDVQGALPLIRNEQNAILREAKIAYWGWVAAGQSMQIQRRLVELAQSRAEVIGPLVERGDLPRLSQIDNDRLIAQRQATFIRAQRRFQETSIRLSLFLRDPEGNMLLADETYLSDFPQMNPPPVERLVPDLQSAIATHPELTQLGFELEKARIDVAEARNLVLGRLDGFVETSQDVGGASTPLRDKSPLELQVGVTGEVPLQRRAGLGRLTATQARLRQLEWRQEFRANRIKIAIQDSYSAMENAYRRFLKASENVRLAQDALDIARRQFETGDIDLIVLNIYEQAIADAELNVIDAEIEYYFAEADYRFGMGQF
jgi:outer membrane protein TolC